MLFAARKTRVPSLLAAAGYAALLFLATLGGVNLYADSTQSGAAVMSRAGSTSVVIKAEDVTTKIVLSAAQSYSGHRLEVTADFTVGPGWHIYGAPMPPEFTVTKVNFAQDLVASQSLNFPPPTPVKFEALGQTFPVYRGSFKAAGHILLKQQLKPGNYQLTGTVEFQECNDLECKIPRSAPFALPLTIDPMVSAPPNA